MAGAAAPTCVVGAGPAGLQVARLLQLAGVPFKAFEASDRAGAFYARFPIHRLLISINKQHTGHGDPEFNLRHDWNSILSRFDAGGVDFPFAAYSDDYLPAADAMVDYLNGYAQHYALNVAYSTRVARVREAAHGGYELEFEAAGGVASRQSCSELVWTAGLFSPRVLPGDSSTITPYHELPYDRAAFRNKSVLIIGAGQSAFETAKHIYGVTAHTMLAYRTAPQFAWATHYVGHLRSVNNDFIDSYQLKSLDALVEDPDLETERFFRDPGSGKIQLHHRAGSELHGSERLNGGWDMVVTAIGWRFDASPFAAMSRPLAMMPTFGGDKYPQLDGAYESASHRNLYVAGAASHGVDKAKHSSGGFIHGFRYTARALVKALLLRRHARPWDSVRVGCARGDVGARRTVVEQAIRYAESMMKRFGTSSGLYQMFDELHDVYLYNRTDGCLTRYEEVPSNFLSELYDSIGRGDDARLHFFTMRFTYGANFSSATRNIFAPDRIVSVPRLPRGSGPMMAEMPQGINGSNFLHPVLEGTVRSPTSCSFDGSPAPITSPRSVFHMLEDIHTAWDRPIDALSLVDYLASRVISADGPCLEPTSDAARELRRVWELLAPGWKRASWSGMPSESPRSWGEFRRRMSSDGVGSEGGGSRVSTPQPNAEPTATCEAFCSSPCSELNGDVGSECGACPSDGGVACHPGAPGYRPPEDAQRRVMVDAQGRSSAARSVDEECEALPTLTPAHPAGLDIPAGEYLTGDHLRNFSEAGFVVLRGELGVSTDGLAAYRPHVTQLAKARGVEEKRGGRGKTLRVVYDVLNNDHGCAAQRLLCSPGVLGAATAFLGSRDACIVLRHAGRVVFKEPGDAGTLVHRDADTWAFEATADGERRARSWAAGAASGEVLEGRIEVNRGLKAVVVWLPLTNTTERSGAMRVQPRSHVARESLLGLDDPNPKMSSAIEMRAGELLLFDAKLVHSSFPNAAEHTREAVQAMFVATGGGSPFVRGAEQLTHGCLCADVTSEALAEVEQAAVAALQEAGSCEVPIAAVECALNYRYPAELVEQVVRHSAKLEVVSPGNLHVASDPGEEEPDLPILSLVSRRQCESSRAL